MSKPAGRLSGQVAVVTGAARGIGRAIARRLAQDGAAIVICDLDPAAADEAGAALRKEGLNASATAADVSNAADVDQFASEVAHKHGRLDILVNNAGLVRDGALHKMSDENWMLVNDVVVRGAFNTCRAFAPLLRAKRADGAHRKVVNIASVSCIYGRELSANYCAAKAGLIGLTKALAREWAPLQVNVNAIAPGFIGGTTLTTPTDDGLTAMKQEFFDRVVAHIPIGRGGRPEDVAGLAAYLASAESDYVTGQVIEIHGGLEILKV